MAKIIEPINIVSISKISHARVCLYLRSKEITDNLVETHPFIIVNNNKLQVRHLIAQTKRIIISNVQTVVPNSVIENKFQEWNIDIKSKINTIKTGWEDLGLNHVESFRRQVYVDLNDVNKIPESTLIVHNDVKYWIYLSAAKLICFLCKEEGHLAKHCKNTEFVSQVLLDNINNTQELPSDIKSTQSNNIVSIINQSDINTQFPALPAENSTALFKIPTSKRQLTNSTISSASNSNLSEITENLNKNKTQDLNIIIKANEKILQPKKKRIKNSKNTDDIMIKLETAKTFFNDNNIETPISIDEIGNFLSDTYGNPDTVNIALKYADNTSTIVDMLRKIYDHIQPKNLKARITRIIKKLDKPGAAYSTSEDLSSTQE